MLPAIRDKEKDLGALGCTGHGHGGSEQWNFKEVLKYCFTNSLPMYVNVYYNTNASAIFVSKVLFVPTRPPPLAQAQMTSGHQLPVSPRKFFIIFHCILFPKISTPLDVYKLHVSTLFSELNKNAETSFS